MKRGKRIFALLALCLLSACSGQNTAAPTPSPEPTATPQPTPTATPMPGLTAEPELITIVAPGQTATFLMGSTDEEIEATSGLRTNSDYYTDDEQPAHNVTLTVPYAIGKYEVTNYQYCDAMNWAIENGLAKIDGDRLVDSSGVFLFLNLDAHYGGYRSQLGIRVEGTRLEPVEKYRDHPVNAVTWYGAAAYANFLSRKNGLTPAYDEATWEWRVGADGYRLPTEAEWEYAARGNERYVYAWGDTMSDQCNRYGDTVPVGYFDGTEKRGKPTKDNSSPLGAYDMTGNVWEWVWDWYGRSYYAVSPAEDPLGPEQGDDRPPYEDDKPTRVWRGGGLLAADDFGYLRIAKRFSAGPDKFYIETGFRIARTLG
ncbi:MAG: SUMF1/EgtB/PvdO family nonheme iron enzyme [Anaerolineales bacterium]|nr:SUMF1/EgtB/PvdO family nonheme iron enzyme [Anaerolineales bacterium]